MLESSQSPKMPYSDRFPEEAAQLFNIVSNSNRLRILISLVDEEASIGQLSEKLDRDRRLVTHYLQTLARANLVRSVRRGRLRVFTSTLSGRSLVRAATTLSGSSGSGPLESPNRQARQRDGSQPAAPGRIDKLPEFVDLLKVFADPIRLRLLSLLTASPEVCVCHLHEALELPPSTVSRHLTTLRQVGLIVGRHHGTWVYYRLALPAHDLNQVISRYLDRDFFESQVIENDRRRLKDLGSCAGP